MKKKIGKDLLDAKPPQQLFPSLGFFTFGAAADTPHSGEKFTGCGLIWIFRPSWRAFGVISHHRLHPTSAQVHFPLHNCWSPASETRCHGLQLALQLLQKSGAATCKEEISCKKSVSQLLLSTEGRSLPAVADGDVFPGSCVNQMKREQLFPLACVGQEMGRNKPEL